MARASFTVEYLHGHPGLGEGGGLIARIRQIWGARVTLGVRKFLTPRGQAYSG